MQFTSVLTTLGALFAAAASAQQYAGEIIETNLPNVPGAEIAYFKIPGVQDSNSKKSANLTLINYMSYGSNGKRLVGSKVQRAVIIVHGLNRDPGTYESNMLSALAKVKSDSNINRDSVAVMAPYFPNGMFALLHLRYYKTLTRSQVTTRAKATHGLTVSSPSVAQLPAPWSGNPRNGLLAPTTSTRTTRRPPRLTLCWIPSCSTSTTGRSSRT